ncbi:hypothetical protein GCM10009641_11450 [Mycobacterium cookii]
MLLLALAISDNFVRCAIIASVVTRPRSDAAKSGAETGFIEFALFGDAHPPVNNMSVTAMTMGVDLFTIAHQVRRRSRNEPSTGGFG